MTVRREKIFSAAEMSYDGFLAGAWDTVCRGLGIADGPAAKGSGQLADLLSPWGSRPVGTRCAWPSKVSRDGFPAELSVNWSRRGIEVRLLFEALGDPPDDAANRDAAIALLYRLEAERGAYLGWFHKISDLCLGSNPADGATVPHRCIWHSIASSESGMDIYKVYLDAGAYGRPEDELMTEIANRLGFASAWRFMTSVRDTITPRPEIDYLALDLVDSPTARVKVYFRHRHATLRQLDRLAAAATTHRSDLARRLYAHLMPLDAVVENEPLTCIAFRPDCSRPTQATTYMRVPGRFPTERAASSAIAALMRHCGLDPASYLDMITALAPGRLDEITGLQELVSCRVKDTTADITVYLRFGVYPQQVNAF
jgi:DMATS type aromatic prenyltransferase